VDRLDGFNPSRLTFARKRRGLTKTRLAKAVGVEPRSITAYESGEFCPDTSNLQRLASLLRFPLTFFYGDDLEELSPDSASFRALTKMTAAQRDTALGCGAMALRLNDWFEKRFELPEAALPDLSGEDPEAAAYMLRQHCGLGELPIKNMVHLLESRGVRVFSLSIDSTSVDAYAMWKNETPFVFLNTMKSAERSRFDAAHELGHLVLHRHGSPQGQAAEKEANAFASAFLMPRASVFTHAPRFASLDAIIERKKIWGVSAAALSYRLHAIGHITDWHYRSLCIDIERRGFRTKEPFEMKRESSQIFAKVFASLRAEGVSKKFIANELHLHVDEVEQLVFGLAITGVSSDHALHASRRSGSAPPALRLVK